MDRNSYFTKGNKKFFLHNNFIATLGFRYYCDILRHGSKKKKYLNFPTREEKCKRKQDVLVSSSERHTGKVSVPSVSGV